MSLVFESAAHKANPNAPGTHVIVTGVGRYDHLPPAVPGMPLAKFTLGLEQLDSPPISAKAFCDWLIGCGTYAGNNAAVLNNPSAPLATAELLLSPQQNYNNGQADIPIEYSTYANIKAATGRWYTRCDTNADNCGVFYFCGHGLEVGSQILVAADYGHNPLSVWEGLFDVLNTAFFARTAKARTISFLVDACRQFSGQLAQDVRAAVPALLNIPGKAQLADQYMFLPATGMNKLAFAPAADVSFYTRALLKSLTDGADSNDQGDGWQVTNESLAQSLRGVLKAESDALLPPQTPPPYVEAVGVLHIPRVPPRAAVVIDCDPAAARPHTEYRLQHPQNQYQRNPDNTPWAVLVSPGVYTLNAICQNPYVSKQLVEQAFFPPKVHVRKLKVV